MCKSAAILMECRKGNTMKDSDGMRVLLFLLCESRDESIFLCAKNAKPVTATHVVNLVNNTRILQRFLTVALSNFRGVCSTYSADHTVISLQIQVQDRRSVRA